METRASYLLVGTFVLLLFVGVIGFVIWLGKFQFDQAFTRYDIVVAGSVSGLRTGSSVELNGIPVGEVTGIRIDPKDVEKVIITIEVPSDTPIKTDTKASLHLTGITGGLKVQLSGGTQNAPPLEPQPGQEHAVIVAKASSLEEFLEGAPELLEELQVLIRRASNLLSPSNERAISETLENVAVVTGALANRADDIELLIDDAASTMENLRDASTAMKELAAELAVSSEYIVTRFDDTLVSVTETSDAVRTAVKTSGPDVDALVRQLRGSAEAFTSMSNQIEDMVAENRAPIRDFTGEGLYELSAVLTQARNLLDGLNRVTTEVQRDPARFLFGDQQQGYETRDGLGR